MTYLKPEELMEQLAQKGGSIVTTSDCAQLEIATAAACGRMAINAQSIGFVRRPCKDEIKPAEEPAPRIRDLAAEGQYYPQED